MNIWKYVKSETESNKCSYVSLIDLHGGLDTFKNIINKNLCSNFSLPNTIDYDSTSSIPGLPVKITYDFVISSLENINTKKATGSDNIPGRL